MFVERCKQKYDIILAKMESLGRMQTLLRCHPTKKVTKTEELTYLSTNIDCGMFFYLNFLPGSRKFISQVSIVFYLGE
jgi:hypothetical protein